MGASGWHHFVAYQPDPAAALEALRWQVFRTGEYYRVPVEPVAFKDFVPPDPDIWEDPEELEQWREEWKEHQRLAKAVPTSPDEALEYAMESGTHSPMDIVNVVDQPPPPRWNPLEHGRYALHALYDRYQQVENQDVGATAYLVSKATLIDWFGSECPTREQAEENIEALIELCERGNACYLPVRSATGGKEWLFVGVTGD